AKSLGGLARRGSIKSVVGWRRHPDSNRGIKVLQTSALPLGYGAARPRLSSPSHAPRQGDNRGSGPYFQRMVQLLDFHRGGPLDPPRLLPPLPEGPGPAGGWLPEPPPEPPWLLALWGASCWYCKKGLQALAPAARALGIPLVALHVPEFPADEAPGYPERVLEELGLPIGTPGI